MGATKRDVSGVFEAELKARRSSRTAVLDKVFHLSPKGITFVTDQFMPEWTEVGVEMRLPASAAQKEQPVGCRGVIVQCAERDEGKGFTVALLFLNLPKYAQQHLTTHPHSAAATSVQISR